MRVAVISKGTWKQSKFNYGKNLRVTCEDIDNPKKYVYLNLTEEQGIVNKWLPSIEPGNILDVSLIQGTNNINKFSQFSLIRKVNYGSK
jgi:hypothetical protein